MYIVEVHEMDIISAIKTTTKESKQTKTKTFVFVVDLKRAVSTAPQRAVLNFSYD